VIFGDDIIDRAGLVYGMMDDVFQFVDTFKEFPPRSFPPGFNPANVMGSTLDTIKQRRNLRQSLDPERIRGTLNRMVEQHIEQRSVPAPR
jgi:hypothetical protein